jgi:anti-sigma-K factor RskA
VKLEELRDLLPLYALHALSKAERQQVEQGLEQHPELLDELKALQKTAADLSSAVQVKPPANLKAKVLNRIRKESDDANSVIQLDTTPSKPSTAQPRRLFPAWLGQVAAVAAVVAIGWAGSMGYRYYPLVQAFLETSTRYETLVDENGKVCGRAMYRANGQTIVWVDLPPPPSGKTYQLWGINQNDHIDLDTFQGGFYVFQMPAGYVSLHVTEEKAGGSREPNQIRALPIEN